MHPKTEKMQFTMLIHNASFQSFLCTTIKETIIKVNLQEKNQSEVDAPKTKKISQNS